MQLDKLDIAASDVKLENAVVDVGKLAGGQGPLLKLIDFGEATAGTTYFCCIACSVAAVCQLTCIHQAVHLPALCSSALA